MKTLVHVVTYKESTQFKENCSYILFSWFSHPYLRSNVVKGTVGGDGESMFWVPHWIPPFLSVLQS